MDLFTLIDKGLRAGFVMLWILAAWAVVKLAAAFVKWLRTRALRDTGRAAGALVHAGKHAVAEMKEGYRNNR